MNKSRFDFQIIISDLRKLIGEYVYQNVAFTSTNHVSSRHLKSNYLQISNLIYRE